MRRWLFGIVAALGLTAGGVLLASSESDAPALPDAPMAMMADDGAFEQAEKPRVLPVIPEIEEPPAADPLTKEQKRFNRVDKNRDDRISLAELVQPRRTRFANLDLDNDGTLRFEEWAISSIDKFEGADADGNGELTREEYATTAPKPRTPKPACNC